MMERCVPYTPVVTVCLAIALHSGTSHAAKWVEADIQMARALRAADPSKRVALMFLNGCSYNLEQALRVGAVLDQLDFAVYFDPLPQRDAGAVADYAALREKVKTPLCAPLEAGNLDHHLRWIEKGATDLGEIDLYAGFTTCLRFIRECQMRGVALDLHAGFPMDMYHFPLYGFVDDKVLPWIGWHSRSPKWVPVATEFRGSETRPQRQPWLARVQTRPVDADGYVRLVYELPGMGVEPDWEWIRQNEIQK